MLSNATKILLKHYLMLPSTTKTLLKYYLMLLKSYLILPSTTKTLLKRWVAIGRNAIGHHLDTTKMLLRTCIVRLFHCTGFDSIFLSDGNQQHVIDDCYLRLIFSLTCDFSFSYCLASIPTKQKSKSKSKIFKTERPIWTTVCHLPIQFCRAIFNQN